MSPDREPDTPGSGSAGNLSDPDGRDSSDGAGVDTPDTIARRTAMVTAMHAAGELPDPRWRQAFEDVPRHRLVPRFLRPADYTRVDFTQRTEWLDAVYSDTTLLTRRTASTVTSSGTMPGLVAEMLHVLDVHDGHRVLQVGTGTGYTAALLCVVLGADRVTTIDVDPGTVQDARRRLGRLGLHPTMLAADGWAGYPPSAPHDRILATCSIPRLPDPWLAEMPPGGRIVAPLAHGIAVVDVHRPGGPAGSAHAVGRFTGTGAYFMPLRPTRTAPTDLHRQQSSRPDRATELGPRDTVYHPRVRFFLSVALPELVIGQHGPRLDDLTVHDRRGAWARLDTDGDRHTVTEGGPRNLWREIEQLHRLWRRHDEPGSGRFTITVDGPEQTIRLDAPHGPYWLLPGN